MENASRALLMAGGVLIAIIIISIAVYMFTTYSNVGTRYETITESNEKIKFNTNFTKFEGRTDITAQEIVTIVNFAKDYYENNQINITVNASGMSDTSNDGLIEFVKSNSNKRFKCDGIYYSNGRVNKIIFR